MRMHGLFSSSFLRWLPSHQPLEVWQTWATGFAQYLRRNQYVRTCGYCKLICYDILHIVHTTTVYSRTCLLYRKCLLFTSCGIIWHHLPEAMLITVSWKGFMYILSLNICSMPWGRAVLMQPSVSQAQLSAGRDKIPAAAGGPLEIS